LICIIIKNNGIIYISISRTTNTAARRRRRITGKQVHSPRQCLPGAGWGILEQKIYPLKLKDHNPAEVPINYYLMGYGNKREVYLWWYHGRGRIYANEYLNKLYIVWDAMTMGRTDGALMRINMAVKKDEDDTLNKELEFVSLLEPVIGDYVPN